MRSSSVLYRLYHLIWAGLDLILPPVCAGCGKPGSRWCANCQTGVVSLKEPLCAVCGMPVGRATEMCADCVQSRPQYRILRSWSAFDGPVREALHRIKYRGDVGVGEALTLPLAGFVRQTNTKADVVVPVPLGKGRRKERGYNQVALFARPLSLALGLAYAPDALVRTRETRSQVGLTRAERHDNVHGAFQAKRSRVNGRMILLVDDVATTGSTLSSCAEALRAAGAQDVSAITVARAVPSHAIVRA